MAALIVRLKGRIEKMKKPDFERSMTRQPPGLSIYVSPVFGKIDPRDIVEFMRKNHLWHWKLQLQLHKYIWDPDMRGV